MEALIDIAVQEKNKPVLFTTGDKNAKIVSENEDILEKYYVFNMPARSIMDCFSKKELFAEFAQKEKFNIPKSFILDEGRNLDFINNITYPCVVKPSYRTFEWDKYNQGNKAHYVNSKEELIEIIERNGIECKVSLIIQEWVPGEDSDLFFCLMYYDKNSRCRLSFTGRKLMQWLPQIGNTCIAENYYSEIVRSKAIELFDKVGYQGIGSVEFKRHQKSGKFLIIEPTAGRVDMQSSIAAAGGVNIPLAYYYEMIGQGYIEEPSCKGRILWLEEDGLVNNLYKSGFKKTLNWGIIKKIIFFKKDFVYFRFCDIKPFLFFCYSCICKVITKIRKTH
ncbi:MAG: hypothetical protein ABII88_06480 [Candidatus Omnitrophota bacterium]